MKNFIKKEIPKFIAFILVLFIFGIVINSNSYIRKDMYYDEFTQGSQVYLNGKLDYMGDVKKYDVSKVKYDDIVVIKKKVDKQNIINPVLVFNNYINAAYEVKVDGKKVVSVGMKAPKNSVVCNNWVCIPIGNTYKEVEMTLRCINGNVFAKIPEILFMNCENEEVSFAISNIEYIVFGLVFIVVGVLLLLFMFVNMIFGIYNKKIVFIALSSIATGNWISATFQIYKIFTDNNIVDFYVEYVSLAMSVLFVNFYVSELYSKGLEKKILLFSRIAIIASISMMVLLQITNIVYMNDTIISLQVSGLISVLVLMNYYIQEVKKNIQASFTLLVETITFGFILIYYVIATRMNSKGMDLLNLIILVFALYILQAITRVIQEIKEIYIMSAEERSVSRLAFLDTLTGISNRRGFEKFISSLNNKEGDKKYTLCSFDLNKLKFINDTYGHKAGDMLIKNFALCLNDAIVDEEFCGRMGGDEFVAMVKMDRTQIFLESLKQIVDKKNNDTEYEYKVSYSVGKASYTNDECDIATILRIADSDMYEMKNRSNHGEKDL